MRQLYLTAATLGLGVVLTWFTAVALERTQVSHHHTTLAQHVVTERPIFSSSRGSMFSGPTF